GGRDLTISRRERRRPRRRSRRSTRLTWSGVHCPENGRRGKDPIVNEAFHLDSTECRPYLPELRDRPDSRTHPQWTIQLAQSPALSSSHPSTTTRNGLAVSNQFHHRKDQQSP